MVLHYRRLVSYAFRGRFSSKTGQECLSLVPNWLRRNPILVKNNTTPFVNLAPNYYYAQTSRSTTCVNPLLRRLYHVDRDHVHHFKSRGLKWWIRHPMDAIKIASAVSLGCALYATNLQTVPYTNRRRVVLLPARLERWAGERAFEWEKSGTYKGRILPASHPDDIRVQKIARDIIGATRGALREDRHRGAQTAHVEEFELEVIVVDDVTFNAFCCPGGKIVVHTGLLRDTKSDDEVAMVIGHEVAHAIARHSGDSFSIMLLEMLTLTNFISAIAFGIVDFFLQHSLSRSYEREADYIGLLLSASAGYDPHAAVQMCRRLEAETSTRLGFLEYLATTHPPLEERAQLLSNPKVMEEALSLYKEAQREKTREEILEFFILLSSYYFNK